MLYWRATLVIMIITYLEVFIFIDHLCILHNRGRRAFLQAIGWREVPSTYNLVRIQLSPWHWHTVWKHLYYEGGFVSVWKKKQEYLLLSLTVHCTWTSKSRCCYTVLRCTAVKEFTDNVRNKQCSCLCEKSIHVEKGTVDTMCDLYYLNYPDSSLVGSHACIMMPQGIWLWQEVTLCLRMSQLAQTVKVGYCWLTLNKGFKCCVYHACSCL